MTPGDEYLSLMRIAQKQAAQEAVRKAIRKKAELRELMARGRRKVRK